MLSYYGSKRVKQCFADLGGASLRWESGWKKKIGMLYLVSLSMEPGQQGIVGRISYMLNRPAKPGPDGREQRQIIGSALNTSDAGPMVNLHSWCWGCFSTKSGAELGSDADPSGHFNECMQSCLLRENHTVLRSPGRTERGILGTYPYCLLGRLRLVSIGTQPTRLGMAPSLLMQSRLEPLAHQPRAGFRDAPSEERDQQFTTPLSLAVTRQ
jgi:hypothetical protein